MYMYIAISYIVISYTCTYVHVYVSFFYTCSLSFSIRYFRCCEYSLHYRSLDNFLLAIKIHVHIQITEHHVHVQVFGWISTIYTCTVENIKKLTFRNRSMIVLRLHLLQIMVAIVLKNDADHSH